MYRAVTWTALQRGINPSDETAVSSLAEQIQIDVLPPSKDDGRPCDVIVEGRDITWETRGRRVDANVSLVASYRRVREAMSRQQRRIGLRGKVVMVGRDIGTVVLPEAGLKIYLDASAQQRARRRYEEILARHGQADYEAILASVIERDHIDSTRDVSPLRAAADAIVINSDSMTADQVFDRVLELCK